MQVKSLRKRILEIMLKNGSTMTIKELYNKFPNQPQTTVRGRVYENVGKGITKVGRGLYISSKAIIEKGNTLEIIDRMVEEGDTFNFIFLDIPYDSKGQKGKNRNLFPKATISPEQFGEFITKAEKLLATDDSPIAFMFTSGKCSKSAHDKYLNKFENTRLKLAKDVGTYTKLWSNGNRMNIGKYLMPIEKIYFFSRSGNVKISEKHFSLTPPFRDYPTAKPLPMIKSLVKQLTNVGDWVFDPFGGSSKVLQACTHLNRKCHMIDICDESINNYALPLITTE